MGWYRKVRIIIFLSCSWLLIMTASCHSAVDRAGPTVHPSQTAPAEEIAPLILATKTFTPTPSTPITATFPAIPSGTMTATLAPTVTPILPSPTDTPDLSGTQVVENILAQSIPSVLQSAPSPDRKWRAEVVRYDCVRVKSGDENAFEILKLIRLIDGSETVLDTQLQYCGGLGAVGLGIAFWAPNSQFLYYTQAREGVPDGCSGGWWRPLFAVDVLNGQKKEMNLGLLSPERKILAYPETQDLVFWDLNGGEIGRVALLHAGWPVGGLAWSPQGTSLVYLQNEDWCSGGRAAVVRVEWPDLETDILLEAEIPAFVNIEWATGNRIILVDDRGNKWRVELAEGR